MAILEERNFIKTNQDSNFLGGNLSNVDSVRTQSNLELRSNTSNLIFYMSRHIYFVSNISEDKSGKLRISAELISCSLL